MVDMRVLFNTNMKMFHLRTVCITHINSVFPCRPQQRMAQEVLTNLKDHPDAWTRVDTILEFSQNMKTKVCTLQGLAVELKHINALLFAIYY